jgi:DNA end-binding protein Ku
VAPRASWKGQLRLSLVSCQVKLFPATSASERISFNQLHKDTHNRINMKPVDPELGLVERTDLVRGYEYEPKQYIIIEDSDIEAVRIESNHTMNIEAFVDSNEVDVLYQDAPYYLAPDGAMAEETFVVLREALRKSGKVAIARLVLTNRERVITIGARDKGMFVTVLRNPNEVRSTTEYFDNIPVGNPDQEMLDLAQKLIEQKVTHFNPKDYEDRYEVALMSMIREKLKGHNPIIAAAPERGNVINLMDALKASLGEAKPAAKSKPAPAKESPAKASLKAALEASKAATPKAASKKKA